MAKDDEGALEKGMMVFEMLYAAWRLLAGDDDRRKSGTGALPGEMQVCCAGK